MASRFRSFQPAQIEVTNLNSPQKDESVSHTTGSPQSEVSTERNGEITFFRWKPTKRQKEILEQLSKEGERNPSHTRTNEITELLKVHGNVEPKNVFYWFQNSLSRNKRKQQKNSLNHEEIAGSSGTPMFSSPSNASTISLGHSTGVTEFSPQGWANSPKSESSTPRNALFRMNLAENEIECQTNRVHKKDKQRKNSKDSLIQKEVAGSPICFSLTNASSSSWEPAMGMAPFSPQILTNSPESASNAEKVAMIPVNLSLNQHLQSRGNDTLCEPICDVSFRNNMQNKVARNHGWLRCFTESTHSPRASNVIINSEVELYERKDELLELFPLHPDGNLRSLSRSFTESTHSPRESNVVIDAEVERYEMKYELMELFPLHPDGNLRSPSSKQYLERKW